MKAAVFLDRDGVLNRVRVHEGKPYPPHHVAELEILPGVPEALKHLKKYGYFLVVVTNQPDVVRGSTTHQEVHMIHQALASQLPIDAWYVCFHDDADDFMCRKPKPGSLLQAAHEHHLDLAHSFMVGDRWKDIEAGQQAGCHTVWINAGYRERSPKNPDHQTTSLHEAAFWITHTHGVMA